MRLRHTHGAEELISESPYVVKDPEDHKGRWNEIFGNDHPIRLEIGTGKGKFLVETAAAYPDINFVGVEKACSVLLKAIRKYEEAGISNVSFLAVYADSLSDIFDEGEIDRIYLNFSDPWPKKRYAKRRLTSERYLPVYDKILRKGGSLEFKTDNRELFDYSLETLSDNGWKITICTYDLHASEYAQGNITTEYEERFSAEGHPICKLTALRPG